MTRSDISFLDASSGDPLFPGNVVIIEWLEERVLNEGGVNDGSTYYVWVDVRSGSSVLDVSLLLSSS